jgi:hypothetical protein
MTHDLPTVQFRTTGHHRFMDQGLTSTQLELLERARTAIHLWSPLHPLEDAQMEILRLHSRKLLERIRPGSFRLSPSGDSQLRQYRESSAPERQSATMS